PPYTLLALRSVLPSVPSLPRLLRRAQGTNRVRGNTSFATRASANLRWLCTVRVSPALLDRRRLSAALRARGAVHPSSRVHLRTASRLIWRCLAYWACATSSIASPVSRSAPDCQRVNLRRADRAR